MSFNLPTGWRAHGCQRIPANLIGGAVPRTAQVDYIQTTSSPVMTAGMVTQIDVGTASAATDARLTLWRVDRRPKSRFGLPRAPSGRLCATFNSCLNIRSLFRCLDGIPQCSAKQYKLVA